MNCLSVEPVISALVDGELDATQEIAILEHLEGCPSCSSEYQRLRQLQTDIRAQAPYFRAPEALRQKVIDSLHPKPQRNWTWMLSAAASVILVISLAANVALLRSHRTENDLIAQQVFSGHVRSVLGTHLLDVISTDRHTVKPWFTGKLDFAPNVKDLAAQGFPLTGGRVDYMAGRPVAALVFRHGNHVINLFTWPSAHPESTETTQAGFNLIEWTKDGMTYWAVSDLNAADLKQFEKLYQE